MNLIYSTVKMSSWSQTIKKKKENPCDLEIYWNDWCRGDKGSSGRNKNSPTRVSLVTGAYTSCPNAFPLHFQLFTDRTTNSEEIFHDIKEYRESCRTAGGRNENKLRDLIQTVTYFFQKRSIAQVFSENGAACRGPCRLPGWDPQLSRLGFPDNAYHVCACSRCLLNARRKDSADPNIKSGSIL